MWLLLCLRRVRHGTFWEGLGGGCFDDAEVDESTGEFVGDDKMFALFAVKSESTMYSAKDVVDQFNTFRKETLVFENLILDSC